MKRIKFLIPTFFSILIIFYSCKSNDDYEDYFAAWKLQNDTYFTNMKDSVGYQFYTNPIDQGGSGYYYKINMQGDSTSRSPTATDSVKVNYRGKMINGGIFDQTFASSFPDSLAKPISFKTNRLIYGWVLNLQQMKVGEIRTVVLPPELGYGAYGVGRIPPSSTLIFQIQLISFKANL